MINIDDRFRVYRTMIEQELKETVKDCIFINSATPTPLLWWNPFFLYKVMIEENN